MESLISLALWAGLMFLMMRFGCGAHAMGRDPEKQATGTQQSGAGDLRWVPPETDTDPVCGKTVRPDKAKSSVHDGIVYDLCSRECREAFEAAPGLYLPGDRAGPASANVGRGIPSNIKST
jgi:YHS domain-containing protein